MLSLMMYKEVCEGVALHVRNKCCCVYVLVSVTFALF